MISSQRLSLTTTAGGAATGTTAPLNGNLLGFRLVLGTATSVDVTIADAYAITLYTKSSLTTNALLLVAKNAVDAAGAAITNSALLYPVNGPLTVTIANGGNAATLAVELLIDQA